jgi:uncharacterized membrane protein YdjX (TVP38/TMEM64 family)
MLETLSQWWHDGLALVSAARPAALFFAIALLPLVGVPASPLLIAAGVRLGTARGYALAMAALLVNFTLGYWLARRWLRGPLTRWLTRRGHTVPRLAAADEVPFILLFRVTPGLPLVIQNYLLGLAEVNFRRYLLLSLAVQSVYALAFVWLGQSLQQSAAWKLLLAVSALVALTLIVALLRRWLNRRKAAKLSVPAAS